MLNVYKYACALFSANSLYLRRLFAKALDVCIYFVAANKLVFDVSEPPWTAVVLRSSVFAQQTRRQKMYRTYIFYRACGCFLYAPSIYTVSLQKLTEVFFESVFLKIYGASSALSHRQNYTSVYSFDCEFRAHAKHRFWLIRAASMPLLKMLNVAERTRMSVVPRGS